MVGGCALNVLFNQRLKKLVTSLNKNLYVPSNPNDCGLALGQFLLEHPNIKTSVYDGFDILDLEKLEDFVQSRNAQKTTTKEITNLIKQGNIIGIVQRSSEVGPRALGNRSIICDPSINNMKDILNAKVKFREWFRPFAPVCRLEDKDIYFEDTSESEYMSYAPYLKNEYHDKLKAICHIDGTARLQTVTKQQHSLFYDILTEMKQSDKIPVILNTSFNIKGQPILTTIKDALYCLDNTQMDYVVIQNFLFKK
jgi:carbamoyltransferase